MIIEVFKEETITEAVNERYDLSIVKSEKMGICILSCYP